MTEEKQNEVPLQEKVEVPSDAEMEGEAMDAFKKRVEERIDIKYDDIPKGEPDDLLGGHIFCKRGEVYVIGVGYPDQDPETGEETYNEFKIVDLSENK